MSRSRFLSFPGGRRAARPAAAWLAFACELAPGLGWPAALALLDQLPPGCPPATVILDLAGSSGIDDDECEALCWLHEQLAAARSRLWLAAPCQLSQVLQDRGVAGALGAGAIHPSRRAAVLAVFAAEPGPGLVTSRVRSALAEPPVPLLPAMAPPPAVAPPAAAAQPPAAAQPSAVQPGPPPAGEPRRPARRLLPLLPGR